MMELWDFVKGLLSDNNLFPLVQVGLVAFVSFAAILSWFHARRAGRGKGATLTVTRGDASMNRFYATYAAISGWFIAVSLSAEVAKNHRVFWMVLDTALIAYLCLLNPWFRNLLVEWANQLTKVERR